MREAAPKPGVLFLATLASAAMLALAGFGLGWFLSGRQLASLSERPDSPPVVVTTGARPGTTSLPAADVPGQDFPDLPRYPGSLRADQERSASAGLVLVDTEYVASAKLDDVREFYRNVFRSEKWTVSGMDASEDEWDFFVTKGEREAVIEMESQGEFVEIEVEVSEPLKDGEAPGTTSGSSQPEPAAPPSGLGDFGDDYDDDFDDELEDD